MALDPEPNLVYASVMNEYYIQDARLLTESVKDKVDVIITSPPYFDMKDYGSDNQIGYGQQYADYLSDMRQVLKQCFEVSKDTGCLWMVVDTLKKEGSIKLLPFDLADEAKRSGWILQDIIIWKKDRTLPFSRRGETRNIFEYVLYFVKSNDFKYYPERISSVDIKEWWIKYPERYGLNGKALTDIWEFPIPVQGSWGKSYVRHFCPLPAKMIDQIIELCSDKGDIIFDPFAGSGAVLAEAYRLDRQFIGCDLSTNYRQMFYDYLPTVKAGTSGNKDEMLKTVLSETLLGLRVLKWPSALLKSYKKSYPDMFDDIEGIIVNENDRTSEIDYVVVTKGNQRRIRETLGLMASKAPFTKYGLKPTLSFTTRLEQVPRWEYQWVSTHNAPKEFEGSSRPFIASDFNLSSRSRFLVDNYKKTGKLSIK